MALLSNYGDKFYVTIIHYSTGAGIFIRIVITLPTVFKKEKLVVLKSLNRGICYFSYCNEKIFTYKSGGHIVGKLHGDNGKAGRQKSCISHGFYNTDDKREYNERVMALHEVKTAEEYGTDARCEDATIEKVLGTYSVELQRKLNMKTYLGISAYF